MAEELRLLQAQAELAEGRFARKDGRELDMHRSIDVSLNPIGPADGSCLIRLGQTCVLCGIRAEIAEKQLVDPFSGINVSVEVQLPFRNFGSSGPSEEEQALSQRLQDILIASEVFPTANSKISSRYFWVLHSTITVIADDGNLIGASLIALSGALSKLRLPVAHHDDENASSQLIVGDNYKEVKCELPIGITFGYINSSLLVDPTREEERLVKGETCVVLNCSGEVVNLSKLGLPPFALSELPSMIKAASTLVIDIRKALQSAEI